MKNAPSPSAVNRLVRTSALPELNGGLRLCGGLNGVQGYAMTDDRLQPIDPSTAKEMYLREREQEVSDRTRQAHHYRLKHFVRWCDCESIENLNELSGRDIHEFRLWRRNDGELNAVSLRTQLQTLRVFFRFCETIDAVQDGLSDLVRVPDVDQEDEQSREILRTERAEKLLEYLRQFEYGSRNHVIIELLWHTGIRVGSIRAIDVSDYDGENGHIAVRHRPETETTLKNGSPGERLVALAPHVCETVDDWVKYNRHNVTDKHGREPLLTSRTGRLAISSIRGILYRLTRPCYQTGECPHNRDTDTCEGTEHGKFSRCPSAVSPHAVRRGSITYHLTSDVPEKVVSDRMNVSQEVLDKHYDERTEEQQVEQRRGYLDNL